MYGYSFFCATVFNNRPRTGSLELLKHLNMQHMPPCTPSGTSNCQSSDVTAWFRGSEFRSSDFNSAAEALRIFGTVSKRMSVTQVTCFTPEAEPRPTRVLPFVYIVSINGNLSTPHLQPSLRPIGIVARRNDAISASRIISAKANLFYLNH